MRILFILCCALALLPGARTAAAADGAGDAAVIGIVLMHGKGGSPQRFVGSLAAALEDKGCLVANIEMPWSKRRDYDVDVAAAEREVKAALAQLRAKGAGKLFVAGHSQGGLFALYFGGRHPVDGVIAIAPGGSVASQGFRERLGTYVEQARQMVAAGKGNDKGSFADYEGAKGVYGIYPTAANYLSWFDPDGAMDEARAVRTMLPQTPVLFVAPTQDYPVLIKVKHAMFDALPRHPLTRLVEPEATHTGAPAAAAGDILRWTAEVAQAGARRD